MNREDIIRIAHESHLDVYGLGTDYAKFADALERFAALVAAAEREKVSAWMIQRSYATGHGDTTEDLLKELDWQVLANWSSAMKTGAENERERIAAEWDGHMYGDLEDIDIGAAIRARKENT